MGDLSPDYSKRDCSLPPGCKNLIDVLNLRQQQRTEKPPGRHAPPAKCPKEGMTIELKPPIPVGELAELLSQKPFKIIADIMELGSFTNLNQNLDFKTAAKVLAKYGVLAKEIS